jgi:hypothetical protein
MHVCLAPGLAGIGSNSQVVDEEPVDEEPIRAK